MRFWLQLLCMWQSRCMSSMTLCALVLSSDVVVTLLLQVGWMGGKHKRLPCKLPSIRPLRDLWTHLIR